jgi:hypothetical protein
MKGKRKATRSSTRKSTGNGKIGRINERLRVLEQKSAYLMKSLVQGDLPEAIAGSNLMTNQSILSNEVATLKLSIHQGTIELNRRLGALDGSMERCIERLGDLDNLLTTGKKKRTKKTWKLRRKTR